MLDYTLNVGIIIGRVILRDQAQLIFSAANMRNGEGGAGKHFNILFKMFFLPFKYHACCVNLFSR